MTEKQNPETVKIMVPWFFDDPLIGRYISVLPTLDIFHHYIIIENGILTYEGSITSFKKRISYELANITKILLRKRDISCFTKEGKLDAWVCLQQAGTEIELSLVDIEGKSHVLIPTFRFYLMSPNFIVNRGHKEWNRFLSELCRYSGLPLEEIG